MDSKTALKSCIDTQYVSDTMVKFQVRALDFFCLSRAENGLTELILETSAFYRSDEDRIRWTTGQKETRNFLTGRNCF